MDIKYCKNISLKYCGDELYEYIWEYLRGYLRGYVLQVTLDKRNLT